jgi:predicted transglutaminase-like cysteine proteinase
VTLPARTASADSSSPWKAWARWLVAVFAAVLADIFCASVTNLACARTDLDRMELLAETQYGKTTATTVRAWRSMIAESRSLPAEAKLRRTNDFINNRIFFEDDIVVWHVVDYWATPLELFGKQAGDCEDFAIAKYITLLLLDIPMEKLRLAYVRAQISGPAGKQTQAHMVLSYYPTPTTEPLVLDNLINEIRPANRRPDLFPVFSFNHAGLWMQGARTSSADPTTRLSKWRNVIERMRKEGLDLSSLSPRSSKSTQKLAKVNRSSRKVTTTRTSTLKVAKTRASSRKAIKIKTSSRKVARR